MDYPAFYQPDRVGQLYVPDAARATAEGREQGISTFEERRTLLLLVDMQVDFVHADGALSVPGAVEDTRRVIEWIFRNLGEITTIAASLDSHLPISIFFPTWWANAAGQHPQPYTVIRSEDVRSGRWRPLYQPDWSVEYCQRLEAQSKKELMIWPFHTLIGTPGHALTPALYEAIAFHSVARRTQPIFLQKGTIPETEYYSILEPEVKVGKHAQGGLNTQFLNMLAEYDLVYIAGEAKSHCVLETVNSIMRYFADQPNILKKFRLLEDCMSSVAHPVIDFEALANEVLARHAALRRVKSTDPIG
ncbi:MAG: nicotinamidase [Anaerolineae bacterium]|nr:nicotinamidase [Anaerolineae bacterium]